MSFQGSRYRLELTTAYGRKVVASLSPSTDLSALAVGSVVRLACRNPERVHLIEAVATAAIPVPV